VPVYAIVNPEPALQGLAAIVSNPQRFVFQSQGWQAT
jgi:glucokinase